MNTPSDLSVIPLLRDSGSILMQRQPKQLDSLLPDVYRKVDFLRSTRAPETRPNTSIALVPVRSNRRRPRRTKCPLLDSVLGPIRRRAASWNTPERRLQARHEDGQVSVYAGGRQQRVHSDWLYGDEQRRLQWLDPSRRQKQPNNNLIFIFLILTGQSSASVRCHSRTCWRVLNPTRSLNSIGCVFFSIREINMINSGTRFIGERRLHMLTLGRPPLL